MVEARPAPRALPALHAPWINGAYAIRNASTVQMLYVGESHTGRLRHTITRHLQHWIDKGQHREAYHRADVKVAWYPSENPLEHESWLIRRYIATDNTKGLPEASQEATDPTNEAPEPADWVEPTEAEIEWFEPVADDAAPF